MVDLLRSISNIAEKFGIIIAIEPFNKMECNIINTLFECYKLVLDTNCENIMLLANYYHMIIENDDLDNILKYGSFLTHVHILKPEDRIFPEEKDFEKFSIFFKNLNKIRYNKRISIEADTKNLGDDAGKSLDFFKKFFYLKSN